MRIQAVAQARPSFVRMLLVAAVAGLLVYSAVQLLIMPLLPVAAQGYSSNAPTPELKAGQDPNGLQTDSSRSTSKTVTGDGQPLTTTSSTGEKTTVSTSNLPTGSTVTTTPVNTASIRITLNLSASEATTEFLAAVKVTYASLLGVAVDRIQITLTTAPSSQLLDGGLIASNQSAAVDLSDYVPALWNGSKWLTIPGATKTLNADGTVSVSVATPPGLVSLLKVKANVLTAPAQRGGFTLGFAGTNQPDKLAAAQTFPVGVIFAGTDFELRYIPGGPAFVQTMTDTNLSVNDSVIVVRRY